MYNSLNLYYLQQLGIRPWVKVMANHHCKLLIILVTPTKPRAKILMGQLMRAISLTENEMTIISVDAQINVKNQKELQQHEPELVLTLGLAQSELAPFSWKCPIISSHSLDELLANPAQKKGLFNDLNAVNELLLRSVESI